MAVITIFGIVLLSAIQSVVFATFPVDVRCGSSSNYKWLNLVQSGSQSCSYTITPFNAFVCQLKVEFSTNLPDPVAAGGDNAPLCASNNALFIGRFRICGTNVNQHLYLDFDGSTLSNTETISANVQGPGPYSYAIRVTQIVCPLGIKRGQDQILGWQSPFANSLIRAVTPETYDRYLVAPTGCDQYFIPLSGFVESFGWNFGNGKYPANLKYNVCFKTLAQSTRLRLTGLDFDMERFATDGIDDSCSDPNNTPQDYIQFPPTARIVETQRTGKNFCGIVLKDQTVESNIFGTAMFTVNTGANRGLFNTKRVFKFRYEVR